MRRGDNNRMQYVRILITVLIILAIYYFAEWQRKSQEKETKKMQNDIKVGDKIVTYTGLSGTVSGKRKCGGFAPDRLQEAGKARDRR